jgi:hypothetical protein
LIDQPDKPMITPASRARTEPVMRGMVGLFFFLSLSVSTRFRPVLYRKSAQRK